MTAPLLKDAFFPLQTLIEEVWEQETQGSGTGSLLKTPAVQEGIETTLSMLQSGTLRIAEKIDGQWQTHQWIKKAILLSFRLYPNELFTNGPANSSQGGSSWYDKVPLKFSQWQEKDFLQAQIRVVPGAIVRCATYIAPNCVIMPSFINLGVYIGPGTMIDTLATIGSCAQIGAKCHISAGAGIGGVLEPLQANPVIVEDNCFIGSGSQVTEGVIVEEGAVIAMGTFLSASTRIVDRQTGAVHYGRVPAYSVVVPGSMPATPSRTGVISPSLACAVIVKQVDASTRAKTAINDLLRF